MLTAASVLALTAPLLACADALKAELDQMLQERATLRSDPTPASVIPVSSQLTCAKPAEALNDPDFSRFFPFSPRLLALLVKTG